MWNNAGRGAALTDDHYTVLGIGPTVGAAEIRRAYRQLALRHHPDRAGVAATATFQRIVEAYRVLSDPAARARYDAAACRPGAPAAPPPGPSPAARAADDRLARLSGSLDQLIARSIARARADGIIELLVTAEEARRGGTVAIQLPLDVPCPTCGGVAGPRVWCRRCEIKGTVVEDVTLCVRLPSFVPDGTTFRLTGERGGRAPALTVRIGG
jgi:molecular chaperone DnaJ